MINNSLPGIKHSATRIVSDIVLVLTFIGTVGAMWYILLNMNNVKPQVIYARRKARYILITFLISVLPPTIPIFDFVLF